MRSLSFVLVIITLCLLLPFAAFAAPDMQPGRWEITSTIEMPGMAFSIPPTKHTQCITSKDLVPQQPQDNAQCRILDNKIDGDTVTWKMECDSQGGTMTSLGKIVYHGSSFEGDMETTGGQMPAPMTMRMSGKRIGSCK